MEPAPLRFALISEHAWPLAAAGGVIAGCLQEEKDLMRLYGARRERLVPRPSASASEGAP